MIRLCCVLFLSLAAISGFAQPTAYPIKPVKFLVAFPPGGNADTTARMVAEELSKMWDKRVVVENRGGAGGTVGTAYGAKQTPDGYTLVQATSATNAIAPSAYPNLSYDPLRDFTYIAAFALTPNVLLVPPKLPVNSVKELVAYARENRGKVNYSSPGVGVTDHLSMELFLKEAGVEALHIPYKGSAEARTALLTGDVQLTLATLGGAVGQVRSGALRALGVTSRQRSPMLPEVPTMAEAGLPSVVAYTWTGLAAPAGTPADIVVKVHRDVMTVLARPEIRERIAASGSETSTMSTEEFRAFVDAEVGKWGDVARRVGLKLE
ncbi:MAG: tripartite tricarboxylate transporter substrate binding protein [Betaproteobacteria bacterium]|nr:tripartite tricarboxylate transporter substrate binding protein [Betaproteobacteria bacterium]